jgi:hypothetical protein
MGVTHLYHFITEIRLLVILLIYELQDSAAHEAYGYYEIYRRPLIICLWVI